MNELPHDYLAEKSLLGCLIIDSMSFAEISDLGLKNVDFFNPQYQIIFEKIKELINADSPVDFVTLCSRLKANGKLENVGGENFILHLIEDQASSANIFHYAKIVKDKSVLRNIIKTAQKVANKGYEYEGAMESFLTEVETDFFQLTMQSKQRGLEVLKTFLKENLKELEVSHRKKGDISGLSTGFPDLDKKLLGMQAGQLIILAARPAMGKTSLALNIALNAVQSTELPIAVFSLEMLAQELSLRIISSESKVDSKKIKTKEFFEQDLQRMSSVIGNLSQLPIYINDSGEVTLIEIKSQCRKIKMEQGLGLVVIDYLQLMRPHINNPSREQQISEISRGLKSLAKELECPVLALSQLNRSVEARADKRPMVSDLRESGSLEQDADIVLLVYRDEVYNENSPHKGIAEIIVGKNRSGETGTVKLAWCGAHTSFSNLEQNREEEFSRA
jgi:replicative DNA helicase